MLEKLPYHWATGLILVQNCLPTVILFSYWCIHLPSHVLHWQVPEEIHSAHFPDKVPSRQFQSTSVSCPMAESMVGLRRWWAGDAEGVPDAISPGPQAVRARGTAAPLHTCVEWCLARVTSVFSRALWSWLTWLHCTKTLQSGPPLTPSIQSIFWRMDSLRKGNPLYLFQ